MIPQPANVPSFLLCPIEDVVEGGGEEGGSFVAGGAAQALSFLDATGQLLDPCHDPPLFLQRREGDFNVL